MRGVEIYNCSFCLLLFLDSSTDEGEVGREVGLQVNGLFY